VVVVEAAMLVVEATLELVVVALVMQAGPAHVVTKTDGPICP